MVNGSVMSIAILMLHATVAHATGLAEGKQPATDQSNQQRVRDDDNARVLTSGVHANGYTVPLYDPSRSMQLALHSDTAYCGDDVSGHGSTASIANWSCPPCRNPAFAGVRVRV